MGYINEHVGRVEVYGKSKLSGRTEFRGSWPNRVWEKNPKTGKWFSRPRTRRERIVVNVRARASAGEDLL